ncbi:MAG: hypothetical protein U0R17_04855 [Acidimicrobiia bacterium]
MNIFFIFVAILIGLVVYVTLAGALRKFWVAPPAEPDPENIAPVDFHYRCTVCGAEVNMTMAPTGEVPDAPRHCREDMVLTTSN